MKSYCFQNLDGNILEMAIKCCQRQILANKIAATNNAGSNNSQTSVTSSSPVILVIRMLINDIVQM